MNVGYSCIFNLCTVLLQFQILFSKPPPSTSLFTDFVALSSSNSSKCFTYGETSSCLISACDFAKISVTCSPNCLYKVFTLRLDGTIVATFIGNSLSTTHLQYRVESSSCESLILYGGCMVSSQWCQGDVVYITGGTTFDIRPTLMPTSHPSVSSSITPSPSVYPTYFPTLRASATFTAIQRNVLSILYTALNGPSWKNNTNWDTSANFGAMHGVSIDADGNIISIDLSDNYLSGSLPDFILCKLTALEILKLDSNSLYGSMPHCWPSSLSTLWLNNNLLSGTVVSELRNIAQIFNLNLKSNYLHGSIDFVFSLSSLRFMDLSHNSFSGSISDQFSSLSQLQYLSIEINRLTGIIPPSIGTLTNIKQILISNNTLSGTMPMTLCDAASALQEVDMSYVVKACYPSCLSEIIVDTGTEVNRCQDYHDIALCSFAPAVYAGIVDSSSFSESVTIESSHPYSDEEDPIAPNSYTLYYEGATSYEISVDSRTDRSFYYLSICDLSYVKCHTYTSKLPGVDLPNAVIRSLTGIYIEFALEDCEDLDLFDVGCYGYSIDVSYVGVTPVSGWECKTATDVSLSYNQTDYADDFCSWTGLTCTDGLLTSIELENYAIEGPLWPEIANLVALQKLKLKNNFLTGSLPTVFVTMSALTEIDLTGNLLSGTIPTEFGLFPSIQNLILSDNLLIGSLPSELILLTGSLQEFSVKQNQISGSLRSELCPLYNVSIDIANTKMSCYEDCWEGSYAVQSSNMLQCIPSSMPTSFPTYQPVLISSSTTSSSTLSIVYIVLIVVLGVTFACLLWYRYISASLIQHYKLSKLPVHKSIAWYSSSAKVVETIAKFPDTLNKRDYYERTAMDMAIVYNCSDEVLIALINLNLPIDPITKEVVDPSLHHHAWHQLVQNDRYEAVVIDVMMNNLTIATELSNCLDDQGRSAVNVASLRCRQIIRECTFFCRRYDIGDMGTPYHKSKTCIVHLATDHGSQVSSIESNKKLRKHSTPLPKGWLSKSGTSDDKEICVENKAVALKFMANSDEYLREVFIRNFGTFDGNFVVDILRTHDANEDALYAQEIGQRKLQDYPYCIVMPAADKTLQAIITTECIAANDWNKIRQITMQIAEALRHMHNKGFIHGDLKPLNIMRVQDRVKLVDLDASARIGLDYCGAKYCSAYIPPEMIHKNGEDDYCVKSYMMDMETGRPQEIERPYDLVKASSAHDAWAFGVILFELCAGEKLFPSDNSDNIVKEYMDDLHDFDDALKRKKLQKIRNDASKKDLSRANSQSPSLARNLVSQLLSKDPSRRPLIDQVLDHPFLSGRSAPRLLGQDAEFDVFISYRVRSDGDIAKLIYERLTESGVKVWWDQKCLKPGESWEEGFCNGLVKSKIFLPILSRGGINDAEYPRCNFSMLRSDSPCDNVLLEHQLALELYARGLVEKIFPIMVGDCSDKTACQYGNYFKDGCDPKVEEGVTVEANIVLLESHLNRLCLGTPIIEDMTVASTKKNIMVNQGRFIEGQLVDALNSIFGDVRSMLKSQSSKNLTSSFSPGPAPSPINQSMYSVNEHIAMFRKKSKAQVVPLNGPSNDELAADVSRTPVLKQMKQQQSSFSLFSFFGNNYVMADEGDNSVSFTSPVKASKPIASSHGGDNVKKVSLSAINAVYVVPETLDGARHNKQFPNSSDAYEAKSPVSKETPHSEGAFFDRRTSDRRMIQVYDETSHGVISKSITCSKDSARFTDLKCSTFDEHVLKDTVYSNNVVIGQYFNIVNGSDQIRSNWITGYYEILPESMKAEENVGDSTVIIFVGDGPDHCVEIGIADPVTCKWDDQTAQIQHLQKGDSCYIPPGNIYRIRNRSSSHACILYWVRIPSYKQLQVTTDIPLMNGPVSPSAVV